MDLTEIEKTVIKTITELGVNGFYALTLDLPHECSEDLIRETVLKNIQDEGPRTNPVNTPFGLWDDPKADAADPTVRHYYGFGMI